jgi:hypothetical protein
MKCPKFREGMGERSLAKTGYRKPMQRPEVRVKTLKRLRVTKTFVSNTGVVHRGQGYDPEVLQFLEKAR